MRETVRRCGLLWGVRAEMPAATRVTEELRQDACRRVVELGWCASGQRVGITAGLTTGVPATSMLQIQQL